MALSFERKIRISRFTFTKMLALFCCFCLKEKMAVAQFTEQGLGEGVNFQYEHMVYIKGMQNPQQVHTFMPEDTPVSRQTVTLTNTTGVSKSVKLTLICYISHDDGVNWNVSYTDPVTINLKPNESLPTKVKESDLYTAPAMPDTPLQIKYRVRVQAGNSASQLFNILQTGNRDNGTADDTVLHRHH
jgi:hypothetical protein